MSYTSGAGWCSLAFRVPSLLQAGMVYESVRDTYCRNCIPSDEQTKAYIAMLTATAGLSGEISAATLFDFSAAAEASKEMAVKK